MTRFALSVTGLSLVLLCSLSIVTAVAHEKTLGKSRQMRVGGALQRARFSSVATQNSSTSAHTQGDLDFKDYMQKLQNDPEYYMAIAAQLIREKPCLRNLVQAVLKVQGDSKAVIRGNFKAYVLVIGFARYLGTISDQEFEKQKKTIVTTVSERIKELGNVAEVIAAQAENFERQFHINYFTTFLDWFLEYCDSPNLNLFVAKCLNSPKGVPRVYNERNEDCVIDLDKPKRMKSMLRTLFSVNPKFQKLTTYKFDGTDSSKEVQELVERLAHLLSKVIASYELYKPDHDRAKSHEMLLGLVSSMFQIIKKQNFLTIPAEKLQEAQGALVTKLVRLGDDLIFR